ncbi:MAG: hypothetical protein H0T92_05385 [Pyrinomonadaceae bacterium]|jgi:hypothetical protein|nr:hypothetical protein [Pyrinomonadaceae bacterium]
MNHTTLEQVIEAAGQLPPEDQRRLQEWLQQQQLEAAANHRRREAMDQQMEKYQRAMRWIAEHSAEYLGEWVVLDGDCLISHGADGRQVYDEAKAAGIETPFLKHIVEEQEPFYAGWQ